WPASQTASGPHPLSSQPKKNISPEKYPAVGVAHRLAVHPSSPYTIKPPPQSIPTLTPPKPQRQNLIPCESYPPLQWRPPSSPPRSRTTSS
uniref:Uncharacterized protein n=1 Tax=Aegilops tauschii subsp. strangulata TaxID=200361 RepID=A0A453B0H8_AEGTS